MHLLKSLFARLSEDGGCSKENGAHGKYSECHGVHTGKNTALHSDLGSKTSLCFILYPIQGKLIYFDFLIHITGITSILQQCWEADWDRISSTQYRANSY